MESTAEEVPKKSSENALPDNSAAVKTPSPPVQEPPKKSKKDERSKKDDKNIEQFMKSLNSVPTLDDKLSLVCKKYVQTADDNKKLQFYIKQSDKRYVLLLKEKEQLQHEFNKTVLVKSKLENLCRELQKQNKAIKEEALLKIREEEERRKETQTKFQSTLSEITTLLQQNNEKNAKLREDNISTTERFRSVVNQYQLREQQVDKMAKQMTLESQLSDAKLQKAALEHQAEKERLLADIETLKVNLSQLRAKNIELQGNETGLRSQLAVYTDKYDEFQNALVKSNQVFGGFKEQMEKMSKKIQSLEKESTSWKKRWETSQSALLDMCGERQASEERVAAASRHLAQMQSLCRTLQAERTVLLNSLKENNIERPPVPTPPPAPAPVAPAAPAPAGNSNVDAMAANCVQLRQSLAHLQSQLNVLTNKKEESPKPEKSKKSKSKKNKTEKKLAQEKEAEANVKESSEEKQANVEEPKEQIADGNEEKIDSKTMESLIQAISIANINLSDLDDSEKSTKPNIDNAENGEQNTEKNNVSEKLNTDVSEIVDEKGEELKLETVKDENLTLESPKDKRETTLKDNKSEVEKDNEETFVCNDNNSAEVIATNKIEVKQIISEIVDDKSIVEGSNEIVEVKSKVQEDNKVEEESKIVEVKAKVDVVESKVEEAIPVEDTAKDEEVNNIVDVKAKVGQVKSKVKEPNQNVVKAKVDQVKSNVQEPTQVEGIVKVEEVNEIDDDQAKANQTKSKVQEPIQVEDTVKVEKVNKIVDVKAKVDKSKSKAQTPKKVADKAKVEEVNNIVDVKAKVEKVKSKAQATKQVAAKAKVEEVNKIVDVKTKVDQVDPITNNINKVNLEVLNTESSIILDADKIVDDKSLSA